MDIKPCFKVQNAINLKSTKLGQMINLNVFFLMVVSSCQQDKICNSTESPAQPRNHGKTPTLDIGS